MANNSKYNASHTIQFSDAIGRHVVIFNSTVVDAQAQFVLTDSSFTQDWDTGKLSLESDVEKLLSLNFWFICLQKEQADAAAKAAKAASDATENNNNA